MQLRKRSNHVDYTEKGSPTTARTRRSMSAVTDVVANSTDSEDGGSSDDTGEGSSGVEISDDIVEVRSVRRRPGSRKHVGGNDLGKETNILVYKKRNAGNYDPASSSDMSEEEEDGDDFLKVKSRKRRKIRAEPRAQPLRAKKSEKTVNYKEISSSDEGDDGGSKGGRFDRGSAGKSRRGHHGSSSELIVDDEELPGSSSMQSNRKKGASNGKIRRIAAPSVDDGESVKCYKRRLKYAGSSSEEDDDDDLRAGDKDSPENVSGRRKHEAPSSSNRTSSELEDEQKGRTTVSKQARRVSNDSNDGPDCIIVDQPHGQTSGANVAIENPLSTKSSYVVDTFGLRIGSEHEYGPITKRISKVEKILAVRDRSTGTPIFCVKLHGRCYRNVANVLEGQLQKECSQLLRTFLKRMYALDRVDGHPGDHARSPAFNPQHLKIDRIVTAEKNKRGTSYLVKWVGLPYSESTWERDEDLSDDVDAIKRYNTFNRKKKTQLASLSSKLVFKDGRSLRSYQEEGVSWLEDKWVNDVNCILADEMGLGKTIQSVAMLETLRLKRGIQGPFLVVAPVSTLGHWQREVETLTHMNCVVYSGNAEDREIIRDHEFKYNEKSKSSDVKFNVLLTSFEMLMKDQNKLGKISWKYVIVDEAHRLKSRESKTTLALKQMDVPDGGLLLLTGTPVQNNTKEIFSLLNLLDSEKFYSEEEFLTNYGDLKNGEQVKDLQDNVLRPRLLRRMKEDVEKSIPQKEETIVWVELTREQRVYYRAIYENSVGVLLKGSQGTNIPSLRNVAMELRKVCNHPLLCDGIEEDLISKHSGSKSKKSLASGANDPDVVQKVLQQSSGKMVLVDKLLPMLKEAGNRVLIFSQFTMMLDLLEDYLISKGYSYERIDGKIRGSDRQAAIDRYSAKGSDIFVFLLSTRAGGLGITLTAADTCLIYDSDWNPQNDLQAMARCHRIGQTKDVKIYRLITRNTYEQKLFECSSRKYGLDEAILGNRLGADIDVEQTVNIESLLKHGAYGMVKEDGDAAAAEFNNQNIHEILANRTQKRLIGGRGVNTFSVATFISQSEMDTEPTEDRTQLLEKGAEEFWQELLPEAYNSAKIVPEKVSFSPLGSRRKRAQVRVDYREDPKAVSDDEFEPAGGSGRDSTDESSVSVQSDDEVGVDSWSEREVKRLEDRLMVLGRDHSEQIQEEANLAHRDVSQIEQVSDFLFQFCHYIETSKSLRAPTTSPKSPDAHSLDQKSDGLVVDQKPAGLPVGQTPAVLILDHNAVVHAGDQKPAVPGPSHNSEELQRPIVAGELLPGAKEREAEGVLEFFPLGCVLVNDPDTGVNYRKEGCLLIGDSRKPNPPACIKKAMRTKNLADRLSKHASRYLQILREREILAMAIAKNDPLYLPPKVPIRSKKIPIWWGVQEDLDLLIGVHKHGHREFKKVRMDPSLCFAKRMSAANQPDGRPINTMELGSGAVVMPPYPSPTADETAQGQDWPHESVLTARLKKLISLLPNGSGAREVNKAAPKSHKRRAPDARCDFDLSNFHTRQYCFFDSSVSDVANQEVRTLLPHYVLVESYLAGLVELKLMNKSWQNLSSRNAEMSGSVVEAGVTGKDTSARAALKEVTGKHMSARAALKEVTGKHMSARAALKEFTVENISTGVTLKDVSHEAVPKMKVHVEVLHHSLETTKSGKEPEFPARKPFFINPEKKEAGIDTNRQQRITGYFIPKVAVAT